MKRFFLIVIAALMIAPVARAQDAATQEQLDRLRAEVTALQSANVELQKRLTDVQKDLQELRMQMAKPSGNYAGAEDVKDLAEAIKEVDRKRAADMKTVQAEFDRLAKVAASAPPPVTERSAPAQSGFKYVIQSGDTLSAIVTAYRNENVKVTVDDVLKANPGLKATSLRVGQEIFIPNPR